MRKLYILGMILGMYATFSACNDEWKDELYTQMLSFKAPLGDNGLSEIYVRYQPDGTGIYQLPVIVSGYLLPGISGMNDGKFLRSIFVSRSVKIKQLALQRAKRRAVRISRRRFGRKHNGFMGNAVFRCQGKNPVIVLLLG